MISESFFLLITKKQGTCLFMKFTRRARKQIETKGILREVNECKTEELENLLKRIENEIKQSEGKDEDYLMAKIITTSRLASMRSKNVKK